MQTEPATPQVDQPTSLPEILTGDPRVLKGIEELKARYEFTDVSLLYDSTVDPFTADGLFTKIRGKQNVAVIATTSEGDVFGGFYSVAVTEQDTNVNDPTVFAFSLESHWRCMTPQMFVVNPWLSEKAGVCFCKNDRFGFVKFGVYGVGCFWLGGVGSQSFSSSCSHVFEDLMDDTLTGKSGTTNPYNCQHLLAFQFN